MKKGTILFLLLFLAGAVSGLAEDKKSQSQACSDEESMVADYQKSLAELVSTIHKEKLEEFQRAYHHRSCLSKLNLSEGILDVATACFDQAIKDASTPKKDIETYRAKRDAYAKLKEKLIQYRDSLKAKEEAKDAKILIEKFDITN
ncbi:MAG: hypothetical protein HY508_04815 [Acidobacteria bacterium]|nr:hypothetical protein [Acidobacteriota bacterium]